MARLSWLVVLFAVLSGFAHARDRTLTLTPAIPPADGQARHALVIGNSAYVQGPLRNPVNDARAVATALNDGGFRVTLIEDATQPAMVRAVRIFGEHIAKGGVGLFYFAGHGIQTRGRNYLIPVNADIAHEEEVEFNAMDVNLVLAKMDAAKNGLNIVILDACRNNPFARTFRSVQTGLAQIDAPTGTFIAFATAPGSVAADGAGEHGIYTKHLLAEMAKPGLPIEQVFKQVRNAVMRETANRQIPWESSSMRGDFAFRPAAAQANVAEVVAEAMRREREAQRGEMERILQAALEQQRLQLEQAGLRPQTAKPAADAAAIEIAFWDSVKASAEPADYRAYLEQFPNGRFAALAKNRIAALAKKTGSATHTAATAPSVLASIPPTPTRGAAPIPARGDSWTYDVLQRDQPLLGKGRYVVTVEAVTANGVLETYQMRDENQRQWAHTDEPVLLNLGVSVFSPYQSLLGELKPGARLRIENLDPRTCRVGWSCQISARVIGREMVRVPAGTFDSVKVEVNQSWTSLGQTNDRAEMISRTLNVWYAPEVRRAVKFVSRGGLSSYADTNYELELVSYKLN